MPATATPSADTLAKLDRDASAAAGAGLSPLRRDLVKPAPVAYALRRAHVAAQLEAIAAGLELHRQHQAEKPRDWGYVGDLGYVAELLERVILSLPGQDAGPVVRVCGLGTGDTDCDCCE